MTCSEVYLQFTGDVRFVCLTLPFNVTRRKLRPILAILHQLQSVRTSVQFDSKENVPKHKLFNGMSTIRACNVIFRSYPTIYVKQTANDPNTIYQMNEYEKGL